MHHFGLIPIVRPRGHFSDFHQPPQCRIPDRPPFRASEIHPQRFVHSPAVALCESDMIIVLKPDCSESQLNHILEKIQEMGFKHEISRGVKRTLVGVLGEEDRLRNAPLRAIPGVEDVMSVLKPFKLASREFKSEDSVFDLGRGVKVGGGNLMLIAGPVPSKGKRSCSKSARRFAMPARMFCGEAPLSRAQVPIASREWAKRVSRSSVVSATNSGCPS